MAKATMPITGTSIMAVKTAIAPRRLFLEFICRIVVLGKSEVRTDFGESRTVDSFATHFGS